MIKPSRTMIITALLFTAVAWVGSVDAQLDATHAAKLSAVRDHLGDTSPDVSWSALAKACERAAALQEIAVDADAHGVSVSLDLTEAVPYRIDFDPATSSIIIDLAGAIAPSDMRTLVLDSTGAVQGVTAKLTRIEPVYVTRATIPFGSAVDVSAGYSGSVLEIQAHSSETFVNSGARAQHDAFVQALASDAGLRSAAILEAGNRCAAAIASLQGTLADAKLVLLEQEFAGFTGQEQLDATKSLAARVDTLALDVERLAAAQQAALNERETALRAIARDAADIAAAADQILNTDDATIKRLAALAASADSRSDEIMTVARQIRQDFQPADASDSVFDTLDGAFSEIRADAGAPAQLANLDAAIDQVSSVGVDIALNDAPFAAVKQPAVTTGQAVAAPAKRANDTPNLGSPAMNVTPFGNVSFMRANEEPIRLAQRMEPRDNIMFTAPRGGTFQLYRKDVPPEQDPLQQPVTIDFRDMDLLNVVSLLAEKGEINVIAGTEVRGTVTASLQDIPLGRAIEIILRMNGLGIIEEAGVYRITTYEEAVESRRETRIIFLQNTRAEDVERTMRQAIRGPEASTFQVSSNDETNTVVLSGPADLVHQMAAVVEKLDITEQVIPTVTRVFPLNHAVPTEIEQIVEDILSDEGEVNSDVRSRQLVVTDTPGKIADIEELVARLDRPVKQVAIEATIVDVVMDDTVQTGIDWVISRLPEGRLQDLSAVSSFATPNVAGGLGVLSVLSGDFDIDLMLMGEVNNNNAEILANPVVVTVENSPARITIAEEFPFREQSETGEGGLLTSTRFKDIGTILDVTPRITYENEVVVAIQVQQSSVSGLTPDNIPIEDEREVLTTLRLQDGQTVFIGGLRKFQDSVGQRKMPLLGNIPVVGVLFGNRNVVQDHVELLVFLTCNVLPDRLPELTPYQQERYDDVAGREMRPTGERTLVESYIHPEIYRDPFYKWRRDK